MTQGTDKIFSPHYPHQLEPGSIQVNGYVLETAMKRWMNAARGLCEDLL